MAEPWPAESDLVTDLPNWKPSQVSTQPLHALKSQIQGNGGHSPSMQPPALQGTRSPRPRTSIPISQLLIEHVSSPLQPSSVVCTPSLDHPVYTSPTSMNYSTSPVGMLPQLYPSDTRRRQHHLDRPPVQYGSLLISPRSNQVSPQDAQSLPKKHVEASARTSHRLTALPLYSSSKRGDLYAGPSGTRQTRNLRRTSALDYTLTVRQQPIAARACGFGERDRRVVDPPPIIELKITNKVTGQPEQDPTAMLALHCSLRSHDGTDINSEAVSPQLDTVHAQRLMGSLVASPYEAKDEHGVPGRFFVFPDLSCRAPGRFRLHFNLLRVDPMNMLPGSVHGGVATIVTDIFVVHAAKDFPGMRASSPLLRALRRQGLSVGVKKGSETRNSKNKAKRENSSDGQDAISGSDVDGETGNCSDFDDTHDQRRERNRNSVGSKYKVNRKKKRDLFT
nr:sexual development regulator velc [Quercus suber]